jgi:hypothetical protein
MGNNSVHTPTTPRHPRRPSNTYALYSASDVYLGGPVWPGVERDGRGGPSVKINQINTVGAITRSSDQAIVVIQIHHGGNGKEQDRYVNIKRREREGGKNLSMASMFMGY